jgi:hypothetical protein
MPLGGAPFAEPVRFSEEDDGVSVALSSLGSVERVRLEEDEEEEAAGARSSLGEERPREW